MKALVFMLLLGLVSCSSTPPSQSARSVEKAELEPIDSKIPYAIAATYTKSGRTWRMVVVKRTLTDADLIVLGTNLHRTYADEAIAIFNDDSQIKAYVNWELHYPDGAYPYPEKWLKQHDVAMINKMLAPGGARWQLMYGESHPTRPSEVLANLD